DLRVCEARARPQAGVGELVDENEIATADQGGGDTEVGEIARAEHARSVRLLEPRQSRFQLAPPRMVAAPEDRSAGAYPIAAQRCDGRLLDSGVMAQVEVIVAAERQQLAAVAQHPKSRHPGGVDECAA